MQPHVLKHLLVALDGLSPPQLNGMFLDHLVNLIGPQQIQQMDHSGQIRKKIQVMHMQFIKVEVVIKEVLRNQTPSEQDLLEQYLIDNL
jgi:hypothetical protein